MLRAKKKESEGKIEKTIEMALKMLESGVSLDIIQKCSGLSDSGMEELISKYISHWKVQRIINVPE